MAPSEVVGLPTGGPATLATAAGQLGLDEDTLTPEESARLVPIVEAVNALVRSWPVSAGAVDMDTWPGEIVLGSSMLCARLFMRKNSPEGILPLGDGSVAYVSRNDPDISMLLGLGTWGAPVVG